jgi:2-hydroxychromene-2-carboxylate isomerase
VPEVEPVEFWYEFASPYSYLAAADLGRHPGVRGRRVVWRPFLLGPLFAAQGWQDSPFNLYPAKGAYMWRDVARLCAAKGLAWRRPSAFPRSGLLAARAAHALSAMGIEALVPAFSLAVYVANFVDDCDIADPAVVAAALSQAGCEADSVLRRAGTAEIKDGLRAATAEAQRRGIFGAPSFIVAGELFWGGDRLDQALAWTPADAAGRGPS